MLPDPDRYPPSKPDPAAPAEPRPTSAQEISTDAAPTAEVAIVGAGLAGLAAARRLAQAGYRTVLFDKGRRPGGRCAARGRAPHTLDHGAQYFTVRDPSLQADLVEWLRAGLVAPWSARLVMLEGPIGASTPRPAGQSDRRYVALPDMNALPRHLAQGLDIRTEIRIQRLQRERGHGWLLADSSGVSHGPFNGLIVALPAPQAAELLFGHGFLEQAARAYPMTPCWAAWCSFDQRPAALADFDGAFVSSGPLAWIAAQASKPGRSGELWMLHASAQWSTAHLEQTPESAAKQLFEALRELTGPLPAPLELEAHRWGFATPAPLPPGARPALDLAPGDPDQRLFLAGDAYAGGRVEGALLSGRAAAERLLSLLAPR
jgi:renalase